MALFDTLKEVLTPYAEKINGHTVDIRDLNTEIDSLNGSLGTLKVTGDSVSISPWYQGYIRSEGTNGNATDACRTNAFFELPQRVAITVTEGFKYSVFEYASNTVASFVRRVYNAQTLSVEFDTTPNHYYRFHVFKIDGSDVAPSDLPTDVLTYNTVGYTDKTLRLSGKPADAKVVGLKIKSINNNLFDANNYNNIGAYPNESTKIVTANANSFSVYIPCSPNKYYTVTKMLSARFYVASTSEIPANGVACTTVLTNSSGTTLTIKTGSIDQYLLVFCYNSTADTLTKDEILNSLKIEEGVTGNSIIQTPYSVMPLDVLNTMSYKPMQKPDKGYICLVSDDGMAELATYAIPMMIDKNVPLTMAVMQSSQVFDGGTMQSAVVDAVNNHGFEIAQHGGVAWTTFTELKLRQFIASETAFFSSLGLIAKSAVVPAHMTTSLIKAVMGGTFGVVRSGFRGLDAEGNPGTITDYYNYYTSGEGSNLYGLSSFNFSDSYQFNVSAIDYAYSNNKVVIAYWHENSLTAETKANIENAIDYAKSKGMTFITLSQVAHLIDMQRTN